MSFINQILQPPSYGFEDEKGELIVPTNKQLLKEAVSHINIFKSKKNWISMFSWLVAFCLLPFLVMFIWKFFAWPYVIIIALYATAIMGTHGTVWLHRYCTHRAYTFSHPIWRFLVQNAVIKTIPEEMYAVSHHVHHAMADLPGDPYNSRAGLLYCMLSEVNHQSIRKDFSEEEYRKASGLMSHTGIARNSYKQYKKWGSIARPGYTFAITLLNWAAWYTIFYFIGGNALACAFFSAALLWFILVRAFNFTGHGGGKEKHVDGIDYDRSNLAINQTRPGLLTGEWHNNHHLFPGSARAGFLPGQLDPAWIWIYSMYKLGMVTSYHDSKQEFMRKYHHKHSLVEMKGRAVTSEQVV